LADSRGREVFSSEKSWERLENTGRNSRIIDSACFCDSAALFNIFCRQLQLELAHLILRFFCFDGCFFSLVQHMHHPIRNVKKAKGNTKSAVTLFRLSIATDYSTT
jgi:hypothetical protein